MPGSFGSIFSIANSALRTHQAAMAVFANNIANAQTPGYTRQRAVIGQLPNQVQPDGILGTGIVLQNVERVRDGMLDTSFRTESDNAGGASARSDLLTRIEGIFQEPSETGLSATLDKFYASWQDLANNPTSVPAKGMVQQMGNQVATQMNGFDARMQALADESYQRLNEQVGRVNQIGQQIDSLNKLIVPQESGGKTAAELRDQRDQLVDELSTLSGVQTIDNKDGSIGVVVAGETIVDQAGARAFNPPNLINRAVTVTFGSSNEVVHRFGGSIGGLLTGINTDINGVRANLDSVATALVHGVNSLHRTGWSAAGDAANLTGESYDTNLTPAALRGSQVDFFESPIGTAPGVTPTVTAHDIKLSTLVASDPSYVSAGRAGWNGVSEVPAPGDNSIALAIAALQTSTTMVDATNGQLTDPPPTTSLPGLSGASISGYWTTSVGAVGLSSSRAKSDVTVATALKSQADTRRQSTSGVAIDEELINLMRTQQAYAAASKVVAAVDEMTKTLIGMV